MRSVRAFFRRTIPPIERVLLVESGSRHLYDKLIPFLYRTFGKIEVDLVTCFAGVPEGFCGTVYRVAEHKDRAKLAAELQARNYSAIGIICAAEPIMTKWKWWLAAKVPAKLFVVNENCDFFWADWGQWRMILHFMLFRAGLTGAAAIPAVARFLFFPLTLSYLLLYAATVHLKRRIRT
jgi:hypothetical protein